MPSREWAVRTTGAALFGLDWSQSGRTLRVTIRKRRGTTATYWLAANEITVFVAGATPASRTSPNSTNNSFPHAMPAATWVNTDVVNYQFELPLGVSSVSVRVLSTQFHTAGWDGDHTEVIPVTPQYDLPAAPTSLVATRTSDAQAALAWEANPTSNAPYATQTVLRSVNDQALAEVVSLSGTVEAYNTALVANRKYTFVIRANNTAGSTDSDQSNVILTTPAKLASLSGAKVSSGIELTLSKLDVPYSEAEVVVESTTDGGSSWDAVHTFAAGDLSTTVPTQWVHTTAPTGGTVQYRATVKTTGGTQGVLSSPVTLSNVMVLNVPPLAPTNLAPSGLVDVAAPVVLSWAHNPSADGAAQSSRQIQYSTDSGATQTDIVSGDSTAQTYAWAVDTGDFSAGQTIQWRVRTAGSQPGTYGAWSAWQTVTLRSSLAVTITSPSGEWTGGAIPVEWSVTAPWGSANQVAYRIVMESDTEVVFDSGTITSPLTTGTIPASAQRNLTEYTITVTVTDNYGLTSLPESTTIETDFLAPGPVGLSWVYDDDLGHLVFTPEFSEETSSELDDTASWMLERRLDGATWVKVGDWEGDAPVSDPLVRIGGASEYRATGFTSLGVAGEQTIFEIPASDVVSRWARLSYGEYFATTVRWGWSQLIEISSGRASEEFEIEGREYPLAVFGGQLSHRLRVSGKLLYKERLGAGGISDALTTSSASDMLTMSKRAGVCLFRDGDGEYWPCRVSEMSVTPKRKQAGQPDEALISFVVTRLGV